MSLFTSEAERLEKFPVAKKQIFLGHAGVTVLPQCVAEAMIEHVRGQLPRSPGVRRSPARH